MFSFSKLFRGASAAEIASPAPAELPAPLSPEQVALIRDSFRKVTPISTAAAEMFYRRLFEIAPEVRPLFPGAPGSEAMAGQGKKLMAMLAIVVQELDDLDALLPAAADLAKRHVDYSVRPEHYAPVGEALIWTLEQGLDDQFTPEVREAWTLAYGALSGAMIRAAYGAEAT